VRKSGSGGTRELRISESTKGAVRIKEGTPFEGKVALRNLCHRRYHRRMPASARPPSRRPHLTRRSSGRPSAAAYLYVRRPEQATVALLATLTGAINDGGSNV